MTRSVLTGLIVTGLFTAAAVGADELAPIIEPPRNAVPHALEQLNRDTLLDVPMAQAAPIDADVANRALIDDLPEWQTTPRPLYETNASPASFNGASLGANAYQASAGVAPLAVNAESLPLPVNRPPAALPAPASQPTATLPSVSQPVPREHLLPRTIPSGGQYQGVSPPTTVPTTAGGQAPNALYQAPQYQAPQYQTPQYQGLQNHGQMFHNGPTQTLNVQTPAAVETGRPSPEYLPSSVQTPNVPTPVAAGQFSGTTADGRPLPSNLNQYPILRNLLSGGYPVDGGRQPVVPSAVQAGGMHPAFSAPGAGVTGGNASLASLYRIEDPEEGVSPEVQALHERVVDLYDGNERELIRQLRELEAESMGQDVSNQEWVTVRGKGKRITWGGRIDTDWVNWLNDDDFGGQSNYLEFRRLRLFAAGEGYGVLEYQLELEFAPEGERDAPVGPGGAPSGVEIKDAFIAMRDLPLFGYVALGHFRTPIGLDERTSTRFNPFMERSLPTRLLPGRELGIAAFNQSPNQNYTCSYGLFFDDIDEATRSIIDDNQGIRFVSRLTWTPYYDELSGGRYVFHTGVGYAVTRPRKRDIGMVASRPVRFSGRPETNRSDRLIDTGSIDTDVYHLVNGEAAWVNGPLSIQGEFTAASFDSPTATDPTLFGAYVFASYFLTGESRPYDRRFGVFRRVRPYENFFLVPTQRGPEGGIGAWEVAFRWSHLNFDDLNDQSLNDLTLGVNWYWNPNTRLMFNWIHPIASNSPLSNDETAEGDIFGMRLQVDF